MTLVVWEQTLYTLCIIGMCVYCFILNRYTRMLAYMYFMIESKRVYFMAVFHGTVIVAYTKDSVAIFLVVGSAFYMLSYYCLY